MLYSALVLLIGKYFNNKAGRSQAPKLQVGKSVAEQQVRHGG